MTINAIKSYVLENKGKTIKTAALALMVIIALIFYLTGNLTSKAEITVVGQEALEPVSEPEIVTVAEVKEEFIVVDIEGAVNAPGIVYLTVGSRVNDAVEMAGGLTSDASTMDVNLAAKLTDGDKVYIPREKEEKSSKQVAAGIVTSGNSGGQAGNTSNAGNGLVNINTANSDQLQVLNGVGPATAQKIIDYRETSGGFKTVEDIMKVSGIGAKTYEKLKDKITV